jgi:hypothetical protein
LCALSQSNPFGKGASLTIDEPIVQQAAVRPKRGAGLPYLLHLEGSNRRASFVTWKSANYDSHPAIAELLGTPGEPPSFLQNGGRALKPSGVLHRLEEKVSSGRAAPDSGFALLNVFEHNQRWYGMTTEHDLVALDRVRIVVPSAFHGIELPEGSFAAGFADKGQVRRRL